MNVLALIQYRVYSFYCKMTRYINILVVQINSSLGLSTQNLLEFKFFLLKAFQYLRLSYTFLKLNVNLISLYENLMLIFTFNYTGKRLFHCFLSHNLFNYSLISIIQIFFFFQWGLVY